jgi:hypothetical protein
MTELIEKLTPEQETLREEFFNRYMAIGWSSEPSDRPTAEQAMAELYKRQKKAVPQFVWFDSPAQAVRTIYESTGDRVQFSCVDGNLESNWLSFFMFCRELKRHMYKPEDEKLLLVWDALAKSTGPVYPYTNYCLMTERPVKAEHDEAGQLHCDDGPALLYRDGYAVYAVHGVRIPSRLGPLIDRPWEITLEVIQDPEVDEDVRTTLQSLWCYEEVDSAGDRVGSGGGRYVREIGATQVDTDVYTAYEGASIMRALLEDKDGRKWLACGDSSTDRVYYIQVPPHVLTCAEAHESINGGIPDSDIVASS